MNSSVMHLLFNKSTQDKNPLDHFQIYLVSRIYCSLPGIQTYKNTNELNIYIQQVRILLLQTLSGLKILGLVLVIKVTYLERMIQNSSMLPKDHDLPKISLPHFGVKVCL